MLDALYDAEAVNVCEPEAVNVSDAVTLLDVLRVKALGFRADRRFV